MQPTDRTSGTSAAAEDIAPPPSARVFVALKIASDLAQELAGLSAGLAGLAVRRVAAADIHLTLVPPWREPAIAEAVAKLGRVAAMHAPFELAFRHVGYGPQPRRPRFLWAECIVNSELAALRAGLLAAFRQTDERPFLPHVTLARIRGNGAALTRKHPIDRDLALSQHVVSAELMQSPPAGGIGYTVLASLPLGLTTSASAPQL
jgi:2'-5' RNA ligase